MSSEVKEMARELIEGDIFDFVVVDEKHYTAYLSEPLIAQKMDVSQHEARLVRKWLLARYEDRLPKVLVP